MRVLTEVSRRSNCVEIVWKGNTVVSWRKERARRFYEVNCSKVNSSRKGKCLVERSAKKVFQKSNWSRKGKSLGKGLRRRLLKGQMRAENTWRALGSSWRLCLLSGSEARVPEAARVIFKTRQTRYVDGQSLKWWWARKTLQHCPAEWTRVLCVSISQHAVLRSMHCYKQVTLSTSETPVKKGLQRNYYKTALLSQVALFIQTNACCEDLFCSRRRTKYHNSDFCGRSRRGELSPHWIQWVRFCCCCRCCCCRCCMKRTIVSWRKTSSNWGRMT